MAKKKEVTVEDKLVALSALQKIDSQIDQIHILRGELPMEVKDLEDEISGLENRIESKLEKVKGLDVGIAQRKELVKGAKELIKKYENQLKEIRNNREHQSLTKEIEYQDLEIQLANKQVKKIQVDIAHKKEIVDSAKERLTSRKEVLALKHSELDTIVESTEKDEAKLGKERAKSSKVVEERLLVGYNRIRENALNGLAVVSIDRDACGGCFNKIPPQRQFEISLRKKVIVCEHCGRIIIDKAMAGLEEG